MKLYLNCFLFYIPSIALLSDVMACSSLSKKGHEGKREELKTFTEFSQLEQSIMAMLYISCLFIITTLRSIEEKRQREAGKD